MWNCMGHEMKENWDWLLIGTISQSHTSVQKAKREENIGRVSK